MVYRIFYSGCSKQDEEYIKGLEIRLKNKKFIPNEEDKKYLVKLDENGKIIYD